MKKTIVIIVFCAFMILGFSDVSAKKTDVIRAAGGTNIAQAGFVVDAGYDSRLDNFVPGYKVVNVALINQSFNIITLNPEKDKWWIKLEGDSKSYQAIHDLRLKDPKALSQIPERARGFVSYPLVLPIGAREVIDIFVSDSLDLTRFNELDIYLDSVNTKLEIIVRQ